MMDIIRLILIFPIILCLIIYAALDNLYHRFVPRKKNTELGDIEARIEAEDA